MPMRTWRRLVVAAVALATVLLFYRWWQAASSRAERHPRHEPEPSGDPATAGDRQGAERGPGDRDPGGGHDAPPLDRQKADRMREQIRALLAEAGTLLPASSASEGRPAPSAVAFPTMPLIPDDAGGTKVDPRYIQDRVRSDLFPLARECYTTALEKNPKLAGKLSVYFRVIGDHKVGGVVDEVKLLGDTTLDDPGMQTCVKESMMAVSFDAPPEDGALTVVYPILFSPDEPPDE
jgi:hypothetical protein